MVKDENANREWSTGRAHMRNGTRGRRERTGMLEREVRMEWGKGKWKVEATRNGEETEEKNG